MKAKEYWRSLEEKADEPGFRALLEEKVSGNPGQFLDGTNRREFLQLMGASLGLAGLTSCSWPEEKILPHTSNPPGRAPGVPVKYATMYELGGVARGILVTNYDGRPIKVEGNEEHPENRGATDSLAQALVLEMYDPDRSRGVVRREGSQALGVDWDEFDAFAATQFAELRARGGNGLAILHESTSSPTFDRLRQAVQTAYPGAKWYEYEPVSRDAERGGSVWAFGAPHRTHYHFDAAKVIVSLDSDFISGHPAAISYARDFVGGRSGEHGRANRLYVFEAAHSLTGTMADHRVPVAGSRVGDLCGALAAALAEQGVSIDGAVQSVAGRFRDAGAEGPMIEKIAHDLAAHRGASIVIAGPRQPAHVHAMAHAINAALGNVGATVTYSQEGGAARATHAESIVALATALEGGSVDCLLMLGGNPVYDAPADLQFAEKLGRARQRIHLSLHENETADHATWHLPRAHALEAWGDGRAFDGTVCLQQPMIEPLFHGRTPIELLAALAELPSRRGYDLVRDTFHAWSGAGDMESAWRSGLHAGLVAGSASAAATPALLGPSIAEAWSRSRPMPAAEGTELVFLPDASTYDGRFANSGWLQELPDPMTKVTWDNCALLSPAGAAGLGVRTGDMVAIEQGGRSLEIVAYVMPGQAAGTVGLPLGYGRTMAGRIGDKVGFDTYNLRASNAMDHASAATVRKLGRRHKLASVQDHHQIDRVGRAERELRTHQLVREATMAEYAAHPEFAKHAGPHVPDGALWEPQEYNGHKWGLSIDLNSCIGCGACTIACVAENNTPVVGKDQVSRGREMHWIRVDRYFTGDEAAPEVAHQPVTCMQCENAPCEQVCPVAATVHSHEGLNDQVYNRCIGTRYCSNNCPFKVRRFNFYNYQTRMWKPSALEKMRANPEVTVRTRGVMEKCTYCIQRINTAKITAKNEQRPLADGEITTACEQACPTRAITFGDLNDPASRVRRTQDHARSYGLLEDLYLRPRTKYMARLRNPVDGEGAAAASGEHHG